MNPHQFRKVAWFGCSFLQFYICFGFFFFSFLRNKKKREIKGACKMKRSNQKRRKLN